MLIKNARFIVAEKILENKNILIENGKIEAIGKTDNSDEVIDASNHIVIPGLINMHTHAAMTLFRGYANDLDLQTWLRKKIWPREIRLKKQHVHYGSLLACIEMIKSGCTCFNDMYFLHEETEKAVKEVGMKAFLSHVIFDYGSSLIGKLIRPLKKYHGRFFLGPHSIYTCSEETLLKTKELAKKYKTKIHIHLSETRHEVYDCWKKRKLRPVEYLDEIGFLGPDVIAVHCSWLTKNEINLLRKNRVGVVHCPISNMKLASGAMPLVELKNAGVILSLGTDGPASNNSSNLFQEMKFASLLCKHEKWDATVGKADEIFDMATKNAARILGSNNGEIRVGKDADLVLININKPELRPITIDRIISHLVYSFSGNVDSVIINGKLVMENKKILSIDEEKVYDLVEKAREDLLGS